MNRLPHLIQRGSMNCLNPWKESAPGSRLSLYHIDCRMYSWRMRSWFWTTERSVRRANMRNCCVPVCFINNCMIIRRINIYNRHECPLLKNAGNWNELVSQGYQLWFGSRNWFPVADPFILRFVVKSPIPFSANVLITPDSIVCSGRNQFLCPYVPFHCLCTAGNGRDSKRSGKQERQQKFSCFFHGFLSSFIGISSSNIQLVVKRNWPSWITS